MAWLWPLIALALIISIPIAIRRGWWWWVENMGNVDVGKEKRDAKNKTSLPADT